ncbi:MAG: hypothetical protein RLZZ454_1705 [Pseudomonadota bacterium]
MPDEIGPELISLATELIHSRQTTLPKRLLAPGPSEKELQAILGAAASAPDHGQLLPWRFILVAETARARLADVFGAALLARDPLATPEQVSQAQEKAFRAPCLLLVVVDESKGDPAIDLSERIISTGTPRLTCRNASFQLGALCKTCFSWPMPMDLAQALPAAKHLNLTCCANCFLFKPPNTRCALSA